MPNNVAVQYGPYAAGPALDSPCEYYSTWDEALDHAQFITEEYGIPYSAWSVKSMEPTLRGDHRQVVNCYPKTRGRK